MTGHRFAEVPQRVRGAEEGAAGADLAERIERKCLLVDGEVDGEDALEHLEGGDVLGHLLDGRCERALEPAGGVQDDVGPGEQRGPERHERLLHRADVGGRRGREPAAAAEREAVATGHLAAGEHREAVNGRGVARLAVVEVQLRHGRAHDDRVARRTSCTSATPASTSAAICATAPARPSGAVPPAKTNGMSTTGWPPFAYSISGAGHTLVVLERADGVHDAEHHGRLRDGFAAAERDRGEIDRIARASSVAPTGKYGLSVQRRTS